MTPQVVSEIAASVAALAALVTVGATVKYGRETARKLEEAGAAQQRSAKLLGDVVETLERTVTLVDEAARSAESSRQREADRLATEAVPRLTIQAPQPGNQVEIDVTAVNTGGEAVPAFFVVLTPDGGVYGGSWEIPRHSRPMRGGVRRIGSTTAQSKVILAVARDANGCWWDQRTFQRVDDPLLDGPDRSEAFTSWARRVTNATG